MTNTTNNLNQIGSLVWWQVSEGNVSRQTLVSAFVNNNLPQEYLPREINSGRAFKRALAKVEKMSNKGQKYRGIVLTKTKEDANRIVMEIHERDIDTNYDSVYMHAADRIVFNKDVGYIDYGSGKYTDIVREFLDDAKDFYTANDIRILVSTLIQDYLHCFPVRDRGAVYFLPQNKAELLDKVKNFLNSLGLSGSIQDFPIYEPKKNEVGEMCKAEMFEEFKKLQEETVNAIATAKQDRVYLNRIEKFENFRTRMIGYATLLELDAKDILDKANECKNILAKALGQGADDGVMDIKI